MNNKYKLKIVGIDSRRFVMKLMSEKVSIYHMEFFSKYSIIIVDDKGYKFISNKKTIYKIIKLRSYGIAHIKELIKKYFIFLIAIGIGIILIKTLSFIVFDIEVEHPKSNIRQLVIDDLSEFGINKYHFKVTNKKRKEIKKKILNKEKDKIEWIEIECVGTKYIVKVEERIKNHTKIDNRKQSIIAKKDAMILDIDADHGEVVKKKYDYVKKGDVIISGIIKNKDNAMAKVHATGRVYGEVWYKVNIDIPIDYKKVSNTGRKKKALGFTFFDKNIFLIPIKYNKYYIKRTSLIKNKILPFSFNYSEINEIKEIAKKYDLDNIDNDAIKLGEEKLKTKIGEKDSIIYKKVLKKYQKDSRIEVDVFFKTKEDITDTLSIEKINLEEYKEGGNSESND